MSRIIAIIGFLPVLWKIPILGIKTMLAHTKELMEYQNGYVAINPTKYNKLIIALRTAVEMGRVH